MGFKGLVNFASGIKTGEIVTGEEAAKDLIDNRLIVSIDPGLVNLAAITFAFGCYNSSTTSFDGQFAKKLISAKSVSRDTSLTNYINRANESNEFANLIDELSKQHGRTMNVADYMAHSTAFQANAEPLLQPIIPARRDGPMLACRVKSSASGAILSTSSLPSTMPWPTGQTRHPSSSLEMVPSATSRAFSRVTTPG
jgi:hypothetical protein